MLTAKARCRFLRTALASHTDRWARWGTGYSRSIGLEQAAATKAHLARLRRGQAKLRANASRREYERWKVRRARFLELLEAFRERKRRTKALHRWRIQVAIQSLHLRLYTHVHTHTHAHIHMHTYMLYP